MKYFKQFERNLKAVRVNKGLTLIEMGAKTGMNWRTLKGYEDGTIWPSKRSLITISKTLRTPLDRIMSGK